MITKKQQQGLNILESIVQSEYPFVVSLKLSDKDPLDRWPTMLNVALEVDPITLSIVYDIPFNKKFKDNPSLWDWYTSDDPSLSYIIHLFPDEYIDEMGWKLNSKMGDFISKVYTQLPVNMRINIYNTSPDYEIPDWALRNLNSPRTINIESFYIAKDSNRPTRFED